MHGILLPRHRAVHVTPTVAKASAGAVEHVPIALVPGLPATLSRLRDLGIWVVGLDDAAERSLFDIADLAVEGICIVLGAEGAGLSRLVRERCDLLVGIPMRGRISSLNVAAAAALATYEVARHRRLTERPEPGRAGGRTPPTRLGDGIRPPGCLGRLRLSCRGRRPTAALYVTRSDPRAAQIGRSEKFLGRLSELP